MPSPLLLSVLLTAAPQAPFPANAPRAELIDSGRASFRVCGLCHGPQGQGDRCPPLANSDFAQGDKRRLIRFALRAGDTVRVNGTLWRGREMPPLEDLSDFEVAALLTYVRSLNDSLVSCTPEDPQAGKWAVCVKTPRPAADMAADSVTPADVADVRASLPTKKP
jgi:mono/diheme cytochrome c family protein